MTQPLASHPGLLALVQDLVPGGRLLRTERLRGGLEATMHALTIQRPDGSPMKVTLRRFERPDARDSPSEHAERTFTKLRIVRTAGIPAPDPLLLDAKGTYLGVPAMVQSFLPGAATWATRGVDRWATELARGALMIHSVTPGHFDLSALPSVTPEGVRDSFNRKLPELVPGDNLMQQVYGLLEEKLGTIKWLSPSLVHTDYHAGNTLFLRGRLTAFLDWAGAMAGDARTDVAQCRLDLVVSHGIGTADVFTAAYERMGGALLPQLWYFDLDRGLRALLYYKEWLVGYHDAGATWLTEEESGARIRTFVRRAIEEAKADA